MLFQHRGKKKKESTEIIIIHYCPIKIQNNFNLINSH
jgi:hypothetical protein